MKRRKLVTFVTVGVLFALGLAVIDSGVLPYRVFIVHTGSMSPTIPSTSAVVVRVNQYSVGQPIAFEEDGTVVTHRLVAINADGTIETKGDANATEDPWKVHTSAIIGGVVAAPQHLGYWLMYLRNPLGLASILFAILTCWLIWSFASSATGPRDPVTSRAGARHTDNSIRHGRRASPVRPVP